MINFRNMDTRSDSVKRLNTGHSYFNSTYSEFANQITNTNPDLCIKKMGMN